MLLYHGTSESLAKVILTEGLKPRGVTKQSNWKHTIQSNPKAVYLTDTYPLVFALSAYKRGSSKYPLVVIEIDTNLLNESNLHPDEDAMEQADRGLDDLPAHWNMAQRTRYYRKLAVNSSMWETSLKHIGSVAYYGSIPPQAITRVAYYSQPKTEVQQAFLMTILDTQVSVQTHQLMGKAHRARLRYLFGDPVTADELTFLPGVDMNDPSIPAEGLEYFKKEREYTEALIADRSNIVVELQNGRIT